MYIICFLTRPFEVEDLSSWTLFKTWLEVQTGIRN